MSDDFSPETRRSALWSGDSRKIANGRATEVYLEKIGEKEIPQLDHIEAVQWGKRLQDVIGRHVGEKLNMELKEADYITINQNCSSTFSIQLYIRNFVIFL